MNRIPCRSCGREQAFSEADLLDVRAKAAFELPPMLPGLCLECALRDPALRAEFDAWGQRHWTRLAASFRAALARPLEMIDRLVEQFR